MNFISIHANYSFQAFHKPHIKKIENMRFECHLLRIDECGLGGGVNRFYGYGGTPEDAYDALRRDIFEKFDFDVIDFVKIWRGGKRWLMNS